MLAVLSPAKKLDFAPPSLKLPATKPQLGKDLDELLGVTAKLKASDLKRLMKLSDSLAKLNFERFQSFEPKPKLGQSAKQAALAFAGDTYVGLQAQDFDEADFEFAQTHVRILSGLYGLLRPLDLIQPYRLEMGTSLTTGRGKDLYGFWGDRIAKTINKEAKKAAGKSGPVLVNLASTEYFKAAHTGALTTPIINCVFKEQRGNQAKVIGFSAKRARGMMARFIVKQRLLEPEGMKDFNETGYRYSKKDSSDSDWVFIRPEK